MIEDMRHLAVIHGLQGELLAMISRTNEIMSGKTDKAELIEIMIQQNESLRDMLWHQRRALDHMAGRPVEPVALEANAVLVGVGGGSAA